ncbi:unnamed protein product [Sphacelaria rigidula]
MWCPRTHGIAPRTYSVPHIIYRNTNMRSVACDWLPYWLRTDESLLGNALCLPAHTRDIRSSNVFGGKFVIPTLAFTKDDPCVLKIQNKSAVDRQGVSHNAMPDPISIRYGGTTSSRYSAHKDWPPSIGT